MLQGVVYSSPAPEADAEALPAPEASPDPEPLEIFGRGGIIGRGLSMFRGLFRGLLAPMFGITIV